MGNNVDSEDKITLREFFDAKLSYIEKQFELSMRSIREATNLAKTEIDIRLQGMNEWRATVKDQTRTFVTRLEHDSMVKGFNIEIKRLNENKSFLEGKVEGKADKEALSSIRKSNIYMMMGIIVAVIFGIASLIINIIK